MLDGMSFLAKTFPWLFEEVKEAPAAVWQERLEKATPQQRRDLAIHKNTPTTALTVLAKDPDQDIRTVLTQRLAKILPTLGSDEQVEVYDLTVEALRGLAEDQVTAVRVALATALKDVAKTPNHIARQLADDVERAVAEPILRYSLSLSDQDLLELIARHPQDWHPVTIAQRNRLNAPIGEAIARTENIEAGVQLLRNDSARLNDETRKLFGRNEAYKKELRARDTIARRLKQEWGHVTDQILVTFLRDHVALDQQTTDKVLRKVHQNLGTQDNLKNKSPAELDADDIINALKLGEIAVVQQALASRAKIPLDTVKRMLDSGTGRAVIALCVKANMPMSFAVTVQQKVSRLPPAKILYPKEGDKSPLTPDEVTWQLEFFGVH